MATREECIKAALAGGVSQGDAAALVDEIGREQARLAASGQSDEVSRRMARRIMDKAEAARARAQAERRLATLNIVAHDRIRTFVERNLSIPTSRPCFAKTACWTAGICSANWRKRWKENPT